MKLLEMLHDETGSVSAKRVIAFIGILTLCLTLVLNTIYSQAVNPSPVLVNAVLTVIVTCIAGSTVDKFSKTVTTAKDETIENLNESTK